MKDSIWLRNSPALMVRIILSPDCFSVGDALRYLDSLHVIKSEFVLISGDIISTIKLDSVLQPHRARVAADKRHIMTVVLKEAAPDHRTREVEDDLVVVLGKDGQICHYEDKPKSATIELETEVLQEHGQVSIRYNLMDTHIDICSPQVLLLFSENFDWKDMRKGCLRGTLSADILGNKVNAHIISGEYAARVSDLRTYDAVSKDMVHGWTHPMVPANNLFCNTKYQFFRRNVYKEGKLSLARSCVIEQDTVVGEGTSVGDGTVISHSVIGRNCRIGKNCTVRGCYLWENVTVGDGVVLDRALLCDGVMVHSGAVVSRGCVLSFNTAVGPGITLPEYSKFTTAEQKEEEEDTEEEEEEEESDEEEGEADGGMWGGGSAAAHGTRGGVSSPESAVVVGLGQQGRGHLYRSNPRHTLTNTVADVAGALQPSHRHAWKADSDEEGEDDEVEQQETKLDFAREVCETLARGIADGAGMDDVELELSSLKLSADKSVVQFSEAVFLALFEIGGAPLAQLQDDAPLSGRQSRTVLTAVKKLLQKWKGLLTKYGQEDETQQMQVFLGLVRACSRHDSVYAGLFNSMLQYVVQMDIISVGPILHWAREAQAGIDDPAKALVKSAQVTLDLLRAQQDDDEDEDEDEDDDDEDDDEEGERREKDHKNRNKDKIKDISKDVDDEDDDENDEDEDEDEDEG
eukprot:gb/GEZN01000730.1/.p1 GENE.gb/GEZN01000730.1/~~gb/GEZN01000730.1/.p1  ORF type:complete len:774 (-),score=197.38 gb/GEZN01000730.1/:1458-3524(-)